MDVLCHAFFLLGDIALGLYFYGMYLDTSYFIIFLIMKWVDVATFYLEEGGRKRKTRNINRTSNLNPAVAPPVLICYLRGLKISLIYERILE